jgi:hypothetical protein
MIHKSTLPLALAVVFALTIAGPVSATTDVADEATTAVVTSALTTTVAPTTATTQNVKMTLEQRIAEWKAKLAAKRSSSEVSDTKGTRELGTALKTVDASCIVKLVDAREVSIQNTWATFNTSMADALKARHTALVTAWGVSDVKVRAQDIKAAMKTWQDAHKTMFTKLKTDKKAAWATFKTSAKSECKVTVSAEEKLTTDLTGTIAL